MDLIGKENLDSAVPDEDVAVGDPDTALAVPAQDNEVAAAADAKGLNPSWAGSFLTDLVVA